MHATTHEVDRLNALLRGELAATETYQQLLEKVGSLFGAADLRQIHADHREAANTLREHVHYFGGEPVQSSGAWGACARLAERASQIFGNTAALKALKEGEEKGIRDYKEALNDEDLPAECKALIRAQLLPRTQAHVHLLDRMLAIV